jgi:hypothetical protein
MHRAAILNEDPANGLASPRCLTTAVTAYARWIELLNLRLSHLVGSSLQILEFEAALPQPGSDVVFGFNVQEPLEPTNDPAEVLNALRLLPQTFVGLT